MKVKPMLYFVTGNDDKLNDALNVLGEDSGFDLRICRFDLDEIQGCPEEIAHKKCSEALKKVGENANVAVMVEDTSLSLDSLGGMPGPFIKYFQRNLKRNDLHKILTAFEDKRAQVISTVAIASSADNIHVFQYKIDGHIVEARGEKGDKYGFDPNFLPAGSSLTLGEMDAERRQKFCARLGVFALLKSQLPYIM